MWRKQRRSKRKPAEPKPVVQSTEAIAKENLERNSKNFRYPASGFVHPIEYTLLYSMLSAHTIYPEDVIKEAIAEEDFRQYLLVNPERKQDEPLYSYAQLCAILALASETYPVPTTELGEPVRDDNSIPQVLCRALLNIVIRHAEEHGLDRKTEVTELLEPISRVTAQNEDKANASLLLPAFVGVGLSVLTGNPLPLYIGYVAGGILASNDATGITNSANNLCQLSKVTNRRADAEKTGLLDEADEY